MVATLLLTVIPAASTSSRSRRVPSAQQRLWLKKLRIAHGDLRCAAPADAQHVLRSPERAPRVFFSYPRQPGETHSRLTRIAYENSITTMRWSSRDYKAFSRQARGKTVYTVNAYTVFFSFTFTTRETSV